MAPTQWVRIPTEVSCCDTFGDIFVTEVFIPCSVLINQLLGASRALNPLPTLLPSTHTDEFKTCMLSDERMRGGPPPSVSLNFRLTAVCVRSN